MFDLNNPYVQKILSNYEEWAPLESTATIGFNGSTASQKISVDTPEVDCDSLIFGGYVDFSNASATVRISSISPKYEWMSNNDQTPVDTPVPAIFGVLTQVEPVRPLILPVFLYRLGKLVMQFTNSATSLTTGGTVTWRGLRLLYPINGGWKTKAKRDQG